jgi:protein involved in polysaccharide export with SLBB domain
MRPITLTAVIYGCLLIFPAGSLFGQTAPDSTGIAHTIRGFDQPIDPDRYLIRPGERLNIVFIKRQIIDLSLTVNFEGRVVSRDLGTIDLGGKTLTEARTLLLEPLRQLYNAEEIAISVSSIYPVAIQVTGRVARPGNYVGYTSQRVSEMIDSAGGIAEGGSSRQIVFSGGPRDLSVDLVLARSGGDLSYDPCLYAGRRIVVPEMAQAPVVVYGEVNEPGVIEIHPGENITRLVDLAGGARPDADIGKSVATNDPTRNIQAPGGIHSGDIIMVPSSIALSGRGEVIVTGAAATVGRHLPLDPSATELGDFIRSIGGLQPQANGDRIAVFRRALDPILEIPTSTRRPVWVSENGTDRIVLENQDSIHVPRKLAFVEVSGAVNRPGLYPYTDSKTLLDYVTMAGGFAGETRDLTLEVFDRVSGLTHAAVERTVVYDGDRIVVSLMEVGR